jgi:hypothetical protein
LQPVASSKKALSFGTAIALVFSIVPLLVFPLAGPAHAQETRAYTLNAFNGDTGGETSTNQTGEVHVLNATIADGPNAGTAQTQNVQIDWEIDCLTNCAGATYSIQSGAANAVDTPTDGDQSAGATDDTRTTPEMSCTINQGTTCDVRYIRNTPGEDLVVAFVDDDKADGNNDGADSDATEGRDETTAPGSVTEPDDTDVVEKDWQGAVAEDITLDCDDDGDAAEDADLEGHPAPEREFNQPGDTATYTCAVWNDNGEGTGEAGDGTQDGGEDPVGGMRIDAENLGGANDPDTTGQPDDSGTPPNATTADYDNACTTDGTGRCTFTLTAPENELGEADVCFWIDADNDSVYDEDPPIPDQLDQDGDGCNEEDWDDQEDDGDSDNRTDIVLKVWTSPGAATFLNLEPENDANNAGTSHSVTATVIDAFGNPVAGAPVDFRIDPDSGSRNAARNSNGVICDNVATNASGQATCTYQDIGTNPATTPPGSPIPPGASEDDQIDACVAQANQPGFDCAEVPGDPDAGDDDDGDEPEFNDSADEVDKFWFGQVPTTDEIILDMFADENEEETFGCGWNGFADSAENIVGTTHTVCATVEDANNQPIPGKAITFTMTGPGFFWVDENGNNDFDPGEEVGQSITVGADENGDAFVRMFSEDAGTTTVTATSDGESDSGQKLWTPAPERIIDCTPETAQNQTGTTHTVPCTVTDRFGNVVPGASLQAVEDGPGQLVNCPTPITNENHYGQTREVCNLTTDANGTAQAQVTSSTEGTQTVEVAIEDDADEDLTDRNDQGDVPIDEDDPCDQLQGNLASEEGDDQDDDVDNDPDAPAGICFDQVSKTWTAEVQPECSDGVDNDGDGEIDFPDDPGCDSPDDDDESNPPVVQSGRCQGFEEGSRTQRSGGGQVIVGTQGPDTLVGTGGPDIICGLGGADTINGRGSRDQIFAGGGNDTAKGAGGNDRIKGGGGSDTLRGNRGNDRLVGGGGRDRLVGGAGRDRLVGGAGGDRLKGGRGNDVLRGNRGNDRLNGGRGRRDRCRGGPGVDTVTNCEL